MAGVVLKQQLLLPFVQRFSYLIVLTESIHLAFWYQLNELLTPTHLHNGRLGVPVE
jgi:hypothetical protein